MTKSVLQKESSTESDDVIKVEFNIIYSISYEVPVLYFTATKKGNNDYNYIYLTICV